MNCPNCNSENCSVMTKIFDWNCDYNCMLNGIDKRCLCKDCGTIFIDDSEIKTLFKEELLSIKSNKGYTYIHEEKANGKLIAFIPYRIVDGEKEFLMRYETCPAHGNDREFCIIIGSVDDINLTVEQTAVKELEEETGYKINLDELQQLDWVWDSKVADTKIYLFSADLSNKKQGVPLTDGTELEKQASCIWVPLKQCYECKDPKVFALLNKLLTKEE